MSGIGERLDHVDDDQRRPLAEPDLQAEAALAEEGLVLMCICHGLPPWADLAGQVPLRSLISNI